jgi:hypothetical protein
VRYFSDVPIGQRITRVDLVLGVFRATQADPDEPTESSDGDVPASAVTNVNEDPVAL